MLNSQTPNKSYYCRNSRQINGGDGIGVCFASRIILSFLNRRSVREDLPALQRTANSEEENAREETNPEPRLQRVLSLRPSLAGPGHDRRQPTRERQPRTVRSRMGPDDEERGDRSTRHRIQVG